MVPDESGILPPGELPLPNGASTFADLDQAPLTGHYHVLQPGQKLPEGLAVVADGIDVVGTSMHAPTHHTIYNTVPMSTEQFTSLFNGLRWIYGGKK